MMILMKNSHSLVDNVHCEKWEGISEKRWSRMGSGGSCRVGGRDREVVRTGGGDHIFHEDSLEQRECSFERALGPPEGEREAELGDLLEQQAAHALFDLLEALALLGEHCADAVRPARSHRISSNQIRSDQIRSLYGNRLSISE